MTDTNNSLAIERELLLTLLRERAEHTDAGKVFHDFNNIIASSLGYAGLAKDLAASAGNDKLARYLDKIENAALRSRDLVRTQLDARREARRQAGTCVQTVTRELPAITADPNLSPDTQILMTSAAAALLVQGRSPWMLTLNTAMRCPHCGADLEDLTIRLHTQDSPLEASEHAYFLGLVAYAEGHLCAEAMQAGEIDVYLKQL